MYQLNLMIYIKYTDTKLVKLDLSVSFS